MPIEEMDKLFGGNDGEADLQRIAHIRAQLGITGGNTKQDALIRDFKKDNSVHVEKVV